MISKKEKELQDWAKLRKDLKYSLCEEDECYYQFVNASENYYFAISGYTALFSHPHSNWEKEMKVNQDKIALWHSRWEEAREKTKKLSEEIMSA